MLLENGVESVYAFLGCVYGRVIAVPMPAPTTGKVERYLSRVRNVIRDGGIRFVLTTALSARKDLEAAVRREVSEDHQIRVHDVVIIPTNTILKTLSGKLQRSGRKASYLDGSLVRCETL